MREASRKKNSGFTLVEVLIAVAILAVVSIPIIQSFVSVAQVNGKSRRKLSATTVAESVMESCKGMTMTEFAAQCDYFGSATVTVPFKIIAGDIENGTAFGGYAAELMASPSGTYSQITSVGQYTADRDGAGFKFRKKTGDKYIFWISEIEMGGGYFDAVVTYQLNTSRSKGTVTYGGTTYNVATELTNKGMRTLRYYDVTIDVYRSQGALSTTVSYDPIVTLTGSITDYNDY